MTTGTTSERKTTETTATAKATMSSYVNPIICDRRTRRFIKDILVEHGIGYRYFGINIAKYNDIALPVTAVLSSGLVDLYAGNNGKKVLTFRGPRGDEKECFKSALYAVSNNGGWQYYDRDYMLVGTRKIVQDNTVENIHYGSNGEKNCAVELITPQFTKGTLSANSVVRFTCRREFFRNSEAAIVSAVLKNSSNMKDVLDTLTTLLEFFAKSKEILEKAQIYIDTETSDPLLRNVSDEVIYGEGHIKTYVITDNEGRMFKVDTSENIRMASFHNGSITSADNHVSFSFNIDSIAGENKLGDFSKEYNSFANVTSMLLEAISSKDNGKNL